MSKLFDYIELMKMRISLFVMLTSIAGYFFGLRSSFDSVILLSLVMGMSLLSGGANALNQYLEREVDAQMKRTQNRPVPSGRISASRALFFAVTLCIVGLLILALGINILTAVLGVVALLSYVFVYTPLKGRTSFCTIVGAIPGAIPPLMGWSAAMGELSYGAWILFAILFLWQLPHFLSLAFLLREDYVRVRYPMLTVISTAIAHRQIVLYTLVLLTVSLLPTLFGMTGLIYFYGALGIGMIFFILGLMSFFGKRELVSARRIFMMSLIYLPVLLTLLVMDKM